MLICTGGGESFSMTINDDLTKHLQSRKKIHLKMMYQIIIKAWLQILYTILNMLHNFPIYDVSLGGGGKYVVADNTSIKPTCSSFY